MRGFAPVDTDIYPLVVKSKKIHDKPIVGIRMFKDSITNKNILLTAANDSIKLMTAVLFGDEAELTETGLYNKHRCGVQSFDIHNDGNYIILVDAMNILHIIERDRLNELTGKTIDKGLMGILHAKFIPDTEMIFSTSFLQGLQTFNVEGIDSITHPYEKIQNVSAVNYSSHRKYLAVALDTGIVDIFDGLTFNHKYTIEDVHFKKIRVIEFTLDEEYILIGCDDKSLSSHILRDVSSSTFNRYCYHTGYILSISFDYGTECSQFASSSSDQKVILWNFISGEPIHVFHNSFKEEVITCVRFSNNGHYLLSGTANGQLFMHRISEDFEEQQINDETIEENGVEMNEEVIQDAMPELSDTSDEEDDENTVNGINHENNEQNANGFYEPKSPDGEVGQGDYIPLSPDEEVGQGDNIPLSPDEDEAGIPITPDSLSQNEGDVKATPLSPDEEMSANPNGPKTPPDSPSPESPSPDSPSPESPEPLNRGNEGGYTPKTPESPDEYQRHQPRTPPSDGD